jgi:hypothetical protein
MWVDVPIEVVRSNSSACRTASMGELTARAGAPFPLVVLDVCTDHEVFSPSRPGRPRSSAVGVTITVR